MNFSYKFLQDFFVKKLPPVEKLGDILNMHSFEVEEIRRKNDDFILGIDVLPNRAPDCLSHQGIAREIGVVLNTSLKKIKKSKLPSRGLLDKVKVEVKDTQSCGRYTAMLVEGIKVGPSPKWLQERLESCGLSPINNIVDICNFVMLEMGQPVHAFDFDKIASDRKGVKTIYVRWAKQNESIHALDDKIYRLNKNILVIADSQGPLAVAGIKGGERAAISSQTTRILIESANFERNAIRRTEKILKLRTDASFRFGYGVPFAFARQAQERILYLVKEIARGRAIGFVDIYSRKPKTKTVNLDIAKIESYLGISLKERKIKEILQRLGFLVIASKNGLLKTKVPEWRLDINIEQDLIEEIGRIVGFENVPSILPVGEIHLAPKNETIVLKDKISAFLKYNGFSEVFNYSFWGEKDREMFNFKNKDLIVLENPLSENNKYLRPNLYAGLVKNIFSNLKFFEKVKIFEFGNVFNKLNSRDAFIEKRNWAIALAENVADDKDLFFYFKGLIEALLKEVGVKKVSFGRTKNALFYPHKSAVIKSGKKQIGVFGQINPAIADNFMKTVQVFVFEGDFEVLKELSRETKIFKGIKKFIPVVRDISVIIPLDENYEDIKKTILVSGGNLILRVELLEVFEEGKGIPKGKKNLLLRVYYYNSSKQLTGKEADKIHQKVINNIERRSSWVVKK